jgi:regulator of cell morphogenesis and NO signaling
MKNLSTKTVREIALELPVTTKVFEEYKIDYCCGGRIPFSEACQKVGADPTAVLEKIDKILANDSDQELDWLKTAQLGELADYIEEKHHTFTKYELENLPPLMEKVARVHGERHPELIELKELFQALCDDLNPHLQKEELILFPYIRQLDPTYPIQKNLSLPCFGSVQNPIRMMMMEHETVGDLLRNMRATTKDFALPEGACPSYTALFVRLEAFEFDLHQHIHLENNLLFPKAIDLEDSKLN